MKDLNNVNIIGRLTNDPELKYTPKGTAILNLSIAVNKSYKKDGQAVEKVSFFDISIYAKLAETLQPYLKQGHRIAVTGELVQDQWKSNGATHSRVKINASSIQLLTPKKSNKGNQVQTSPDGEPASDETEPKELEIY